LHELIGIGYPAINGFFHSRVGNPSIYILKNKLVMAGKGAGDNILASAV
jgi:hypothetical protein